MSLKSSLFRDVSPFHFQFNEMDVYGDSSIYFQLSNVQHLGDFNRSVRAAVSHVSQGTLHK